MNTVKITTINDRTAVIAIDQISAVFKGPGYEDDRWVIELKTRNYFHVLPEFGKQFERWFAGDLTMAELYELVLIA